MKKHLDNTKPEVNLARAIWGPLSEATENALKQLLQTHSLSVASGDLLFLQNRWYVTHAGLLRLSRRRGCAGIRVNPVRDFCDPALTRWTFKATVYRSRNCRGFVGFGDADPSNVSSVVRGAEMRVAETRAVNRALRKAYGIGICSVEEIGSRAEPHEESTLTSEPTNGNSNGRTVRDRLCQIIRQYRLDASLVKAYATDSCGVKTLRDATREQVEEFVARLADWAEKDLEALFCQLNSYSPQKEVVA